MAPSSEKTKAIDGFDRAILSELERNARLNFRELGERVNLSANAVAERVRRLVSMDVIHGFRAQVNPAALGLHMSAFIDVKTGANSGPDGLRKLLTRIPEVRRAVWTTGEFDFTIEIVCRDQADLVRIVEILRTQGGIRETYTRIIGMEVGGAEAAGLNVEPRV